MTKHLIQGSPEWHLAKAGMLTGSNFAAAMGLNPYQSKQKLYRQLIGEDPPFDGNEMTQWGLDHEDDAVTAYEAHTGVFVVKTGFWSYPDPSYLGASPDGLVSDDGLIECKCKFSQELWDHVPDHYLTQVIGQLAITERQWCDFVSWSPADIAIFRVNYSPEYWSAMLPLLDKFWNDLTNRRPPKRAKKPVMPEVEVERLK